MHRTKIGKRIMEESMMVNMSGDLARFKVEIRTDMQFTIY